MSSVAPLSLTWHGDFNFTNGPEGPPITLDSGKADIPSPMQALAYGLMGCMAMDVVLILQKGRHDLRALSAHFEGERAEEVPKRYVKMHVRFDITGDIPDDAVQRAIDLSHEKYCSVSNSLRRDIAFTTSFVITR